MKDINLLKLEDMAKEHGVVFIETLIGSPRNFVFDTRKRGELTRFGDRIEILYDQIEGFDPMRDIEKLVSRIGHTETAKKIGVNYESVKYWSRSNYKTQLKAGVKLEVYELWKKGEL